MHLPSRFGSYQTRLPGMKHLILSHTRIDVFIVGLWSLMNCTLAHDHDNFVLGFWYK